MIVSLQEGGLAVDPDNLVLDLGSAVFLASTDDGLVFKTSGACTGRILRSRPPTIILSWPDTELRLQAEHGSCLIIDLADYIIVVYDAISTDCSVIRFDPENFCDDAFEIFISIVSEYCTFISREQAAENNVLLALGRSPEILLSANIIEGPEPEQGRPGLSARIDSGANVIVSGIQRCSSIICGSLTVGSELIQRHIEPAPNPMPIHPRIRAGFHAVGTAANAVASGMSTMGESISSSLFGGDSNHVIPSASVPEVVRSSIRGAANVALATTDASLSIFQSALNAATGVLARKYGEGLGEILEDGTRILYSIRLASRALRRVCFQLLIDGLRDEVIPYRILQ